jgi:hypothetical protein
MEFPVVTGFQTPAESICGKGSNNANYVEAAPSAIKSQGNLPARTFLRMDYILLVHIV